MRRKKTNYVENQKQIKMSNNCGNGGSFYIEFECETGPPI